jgi:hypothetical protein
VGGWGSLDDEDSGEERLLAAENGRQQARIVSV